MSTSQNQIGYLELLRGNRDLRRLWLGNVASLLGDWFNMIAIYTLVEALTGSPLALGWVFIVKTLSYALASPFAGLVADRLDRRRLMVAADLLRALLVLGFLLVDDPGDVALLYALTAAQMIVGAVFLPAQNASIPNITNARELLTANALMAATWSSLLAIGAGLGGVAVAWLGIETVFVIDSVSYLVSASFIYRIAIPRTAAEASGPQPAGARPATSLVRQAAAGVWSGWRYLSQNPHIARMALVKTAWATAGAALVYMLVLLGKQILPAAPSVGIGLLYFARGVGTGVGPVAARAWVPRRELWPVGFGLGICASGLAYGAIGLVPWGGWVVLLALFAHIPSGANWALSTVLIQERTPDRYRGRVFSTEFLILTLVDAAMIFVASLLLEREILTLRSGIQVFALIQLVCGAAWLVLAVPSELAWLRRQQPAAPEPEA